MSRAAYRALAAGLLAAAVAVPAWAGQRTVRARVASHDQAPVTIHRPTVALTQTYSNPGQFPFAAIDGNEVRISRSRVRYLNRLNQVAPTFVLEGEFEVKNSGRKKIEVLELTAIGLNAFHERVTNDEQSLAQPLLPREQKRIRWSRTMPNEDVFEIVFAVTAVRFSDGTVWTPTEELILSP